MPRLAGNNTWYWCFSCKQKFQTISDKMIVKENEYRWNSRMNDDEDMADFQVRCGLCGSTHVEKLKVEPEGD